MALKYFTPVMIEKKKKVQQPEPTLITSTSMFCHHLDLINISRFSLSNNPLFSTHLNTFHVVFLYGFVPVTRKDFAVKTNKKR